ncbi:MAG: non-canonical purine NTP pyrophosphatase [Actinomycetaceae bacterium]|nr:non-canonical purine NTP pyrophosphatase [Actinomycetaceae bacterium]
MTDFKLALATGNQHKVAELFAILQPLLPELSVDQIGTTRDFDVAEPVEDAPSFEGNALIKARALAEATGLPVIADDSGLAVDILGGAPGIFSARWSGRHGDDRANLELLLNQLADVPAQYRGAKFVCAAALVDPRGGRPGLESEQADLSVLADSGAQLSSNEVVEVGEMRGTLITEPRGSGGFGYDPIFVANGYEVTTAELSAEEKNRISHRGKAFRALAPAIVRALQAD